LASDLPTERSKKAMKKLRRSLSLSSLILVGVAAPATSQAQIAVNMSLLKCGQYLAMSPDQSRIYAAWMSGWFNQKMGTTYVDLEAYARNVENVKAWCGTNPEELVMTGLQRATGK
jgi:HdeA/HdeB family